MDQGNYIQGKAGNTEDLCESFDQLCIRFVSFIDAPDIRPGVINDSQFEQYDFIVSHFLFFFKKPFSLFV